MSPLQEIRRAKLQKLTRPPSEETERADTREHGRMRDASGGGCAD